MLPISLSSCCLISTPLWPEILAPPKTPNNNPIAFGLGPTLANVVSPSFLHNKKSRRDRLLFYVMFLLICLPHCTGGQSQCRHCTFHHLLLCNTFLLQEYVSLNTQFLVALSGKLFFQPSYQADVWKTIKKYFIDKKIPKEERDRVPLVLSNEDVIWIPGRYLAEHIRITETTKRICKLCFSPT